MSTAWVVASYTIRECARRRVFAVVPVVTAVFLALYAVGAHFAFRSVEGNVSVGFGAVDARALTGATLVGLSMFVTLFLGAALAIFLTFSAVRGDAEQGLLQPLVVRPVARSGLLLGRFIGASVVCTAYVAFLYAACVAATGIIGSWWPDPLLLPGLNLVAGVLVVIALSLLGSIFLSALANGIAMFMIYGAGLLAGLLGQLGDVLSSQTLEATGKVAAWLLPFEALYQAGLNSLTSSATGLTRVIVQLGPLGGAQQGGPLLALWALGYVSCVGACALLAFSRRDL
jgi:ABC-type transport system involved in multi-copper enzyme maturation permease subunit